MTKKPSFRARWLNRRIWRWHWNEFKYLLEVAFLFSRDPEYEKYLAEERVKIRAFLVGHLETCYVARYPDWHVCPSEVTLHSEKVGEHWWSGWPGAFCMKCFAGDLMESCIGCVCECRCHDEFWEGYNEAMREGEPDGNLSEL